MTDKYKDAIEQIVNIITTPGEEMTDGECMDSVWSIIENDLCINLHSIRDYKIIMMEANNLEKGE
jgi:hypothetical protein